MPNPNYQQYIMPYMQYPLPVAMQSQQTPPPQQSQPQQANQIQNAGFIMVRSEEEAYRYPVAPGNCVTFKVENEPIVLEKSMSFSQLETPRIDRYRLVREDIIDEPKPIETIIDDTSATDELKGDIEAIKDDLAMIKKHLFNCNPKSAPKKREVDDE